MGNGASDRKETLKNFREVIAKATPSDHSRPVASTYHVDYLLAPDISIPYNSGAAMIWLLCDETQDIQSLDRESAVTETLSELEVLDHVQEAVQQFQALGSW